MTLSKTVLDYLSNNAKQVGVAQLRADDDLFQLGVLDSFSLVDLISMLEEDCEIKIPDVDVNAGNFQSINAIERYVESWKG